MAISVRSSTDVTITSTLLTERRERTFLVLAGIFLSAMTLLNVVGITRFIQLGPLALAVGVLPYPLTFLCTDLSETSPGDCRAAIADSISSGKAVPSVKPSAPP